MPKAFRECTLPDERFPVDGLSGCLPAAVSANKTEQSGGLAGPTPIGATTTMVTSTPIKKDNVATALDRAIDAGGGLLRLTPTWVPRSFLHPGKRIKLAPTNWYAYGAHRGGIDERWFGSTTEAANEGRVPDEGLSYVVHEGKRFTLRDAVAER